MIQRSKMLSVQEIQTFSLSNYENEFLQHPDLVMTWAVNETFLARFREGFAAYISGHWAEARLILEETRKARRSADGRKVRLQFEEGWTAKIICVDTHTVNC